ncbi:unnamed protein product [Camellia sinensis]
MHARAQDFSLERRDTPDQARSSARKLARAEAASEKKPEDSQSSLEQRNKYQGMIPKQIVGLPSLTLGLSVAQNFLAGPLPSEVSNMKNIGLFDVSRNQLSGNIPSTLGDCLVLEFLNMEGNHFEGTIPPSFKQLRGLQMLDLSHNSLFGKIPSFLVPKLLQATEGFSLRNMIGEGSYGSVYKGILNCETTKAIAVKVLNLQVRGGNKSFLNKCEALRNIRHRNLVKIVTACSSIDFNGNEFKALVFEFISNGSLESRLHSSSLNQEDSRNLNLVQRLNIAVDVASALDYLHNHCETPIIHCDLKPSNVLLDDDLSARVSDFGLARICLTKTGASTHTHDSTSSRIRGTIGYIAPDRMMLTFSVFPSPKVSDTVVDFARLLGTSASFLSELRSLSLFNSRSTFEYAVGGEVSIKSDVYSYGILLQEMFIGKRPTDNMFVDNFNLHNYVRTAAAEQVMEIVDPSLISEGSNESNRTSGSSRGDIVRTVKCLGCILQIGVMCSVDLPCERINISDALMELQAIRDVYLGKREMK